MGKLWNLFEFSTRKNKIYKIKKNYLIIIIYNIYKFNKFN